MNIIEAIKSGKRYRRRGRGELDWYDPDYLDYVFSMRDVLDSDWEVEVAPVTITREQFDKAWCEALAEHVKLDSSWEFGRWEKAVDTHSSIKKLLMKELGL